MHKAGPVEVKIVGESNFNERIITVKSPINGGLGLGSQMVPFIKIVPQYPTTAALQWKNNVKEQKIASTG